jgi:hypothetical protein
VRGNLVGQHHDRFNLRVGYRGPIWNIAQARLRRGGAGRLGPPAWRPPRRHIDAVPSGLKRPGPIHRWSFLRSRGRSSQPAPVGSDQNPSLGFICDQPQKAGFVLVGLLQREPAVSDGAGVIHNANSNATRNTDFQSQLREKCSTRPEILNARSAPRRREVAAIKRFATKHTSFATAASLPQSA